jgi:hypothetical protein
MPGPRPEDRKKKASSVPSAYLFPGDSLLVLLVITHNKVHYARFHARTHARTGMQANRAIAKKNQGEPRRRFRINALETRGGD